MSESNWNPRQPNIRVRMKNNPGKQGLTTGKVVESTGRLLVEVNFGTNEVCLRKYEQLEPIEENESLKDLISQGKYGTLSDLRRIVTYEKIKGQLTNIIYSMESSNTDFYPHQFKPVLKLLDSPVGRLLIADEVGLGKTIEAILIWKELQAREDARRLIVLCPAVLREKWKFDLLTKFNIDSEIINAQKLLEQVKKCKPTSSFVCIVSIEGMRPRRNWDDLEQRDNRSLLARFLDEHPSTEEFSIFDLAIIDEAHYLRNAETANNQLGELIRDSSKHLLLLTATPIQIKNENLFNLLRLVSPEDFEYHQIFEAMLAANKPIIEAMQKLDTYDIQLIDDLLEQAQQSKYFSSNSRIQQIRTEIADQINIDTKKRIEWKRTLENCSLLGQYMTRSHKKDVLIDQAVRSPMALSIEFSDLEKSVYENVTKQIRKLAIGQQGVSFFSLVLRQRQMASCMVAALKSWQEKNILQKLTEDARESFIEDLWETGYELGEEELNDSCLNFNTSSISAQDIQDLENKDTKYIKLVEFLKDELLKNPLEKFILFSYFKGTLNYLSQRLKKDGISNCLLHGDILKEKKSQFKSKDDILKMFQNTPTSVLLSSEVGSEGVDLQFCRFLINYDLPWNPMRVEQRIGRIDRLGQKHENISIIHFKINNTIEEKILTRLYERINIFKESIGDLQEILGEQTEQLVKDLLNPNLSDQQREKKANRIFAAIENEKQEQKKMESEAINLVAFSNYILESISESRSKGRWLRPEETRIFIDDFFGKYYPETSIVSKANDTVGIDLSNQAKVDLRLFTEEKKLGTKTNLSYMTVNCLFDPKKAEAFGQSKLEILSPVHPLIQWIRFQYESHANQTSNNHPFYSATAVEILSSNVSDIVNCVAGVYMFVMQKWELHGLRSDVRLVCRAININDHKFLYEEDMEAILDRVIFHGKTKENVINLVDQQKIIDAYQKCDQDLDIEFERISEEFEMENNDRCDVQLQNIEAYQQRKTESLSQRIEKFKIEGKLRMIPAFEGQLRKLEQDCQVNKKRLDKKRNVEFSNPKLAAGLIFVKEG